MDTKNNRDEFIDFAKGIAIILVVLGHSIQYGSGSEYLAEGLFFDNWLYKFIYSFHMPLFMMLSGYVLYYSLEKYDSLLRITVRKVVALGLPIMAWGIFPFIRSLIDDHTGLQPLDIVKLVKRYIRVCIANHWFLWAVLICSIIVILARYCFKDSWIIYSIVLMITFFTLDGYNTYLYKFVYPFFIIGYMYNQYKSRYKVGHIRVMTFALALLYIVLYCFYDLETYIYTSKYSLLNGKGIHQLIIDIHRFAIGLLGCLIAIRTLKYIYERLADRMKVAISFVGRNSLGIYVISGFVFSHILPSVTSSWRGLNYLLAIIETLLITALCMCITVVIKKNRSLSKILLGS